MHINKILNGIIYRLESDLRTIYNNTQDHTYAPTILQFYNNTNDPQTFRIMLSDKTNYPTQDNAVVCLSAEIFGVFNSVVFIKVWNDEIQSNFNHNWKRTPIITEASAEAVYVILESHIDKAKMVRDIIDS